MRIIGVYIAIAALCGTIPLHAQTGGTTQQQVKSGVITGRIVHGETGEPIPEVVVQVEGTPIGAQADADGRFRITGVQAGTVTLIVRRIGFEPKSVSNVKVTAGVTTTQNITLLPKSTVLAAQEITAAAERGTVNEALDKQRTAVAIVNSITAEQISRSPDGDAAAAMQRVSGVTVQDNKYVFVRGLGERYTTASLNGARLPSPEPERKVVPLDMFPSGLLQNVTTAKTFTADLPGDFSGAQVDIQTREFPIRNTLSFSTGTSYNSSVNGKQLYFAPTVGREWLGFAGGARALPDPVRDGGNFGSSTQAERNAAIRSFRNAWNPDYSRSGMPTSLSVSAGGQTDFLGDKLGYVASGSYSYSQSARIEEHYASVLGLNAVQGQSGTTSVQWGGLLNLSRSFGLRTRLLLNNTYNRTADNTAQFAQGIDDSYNNGPARFSTLSFVARTIRSNQLRLEHTFDLDRQLDLSVTSSGVTRKEPDRSESEYVRDVDPVSGEYLPFALHTNADGARRTFSDLDESNWNLNADLKWHAFKLGTSFRMTRRDTDNFSYSMITTSLPREIRELPLEEILQSEYVQGDAAYFSIIQNSTGGSYWARDYVTAGYLMWERPLFDDRLRIITGARLETTRIKVGTERTDGSDTTAKLNNVDLLPSLIANIKLNESQALRLSATQTLARPEYRELSPAPSRDVIKKQDQFGNPLLVRSLIQNLDARWEWFPNPGEVISLGVFYKHFNKPIERVDVATSGASQFSFINATAASNYGIEGEIRKGLLGALSPVTGFVNITLMQSRIDMSGDTLSSLTNDKRPMVGQAPYVLNTGLTYASSSGRMSATVLYNIVGKRIYAAGSDPNPDIYELARPTLDLSIRMPVFANVSFSASSSNLLDRAYELRQGDTIRERYRTGRSFSLGLSVSR